ncbi:trypsin-like serine peptidase [Amycolatopsis umgeniensis]|uniref:V8-like Glu-specific endopeptidase n=1 Tax=Amycolatopsis umgeniensis TaxID=336628 RepID=A0A841AUK5_9PSEU|nr:hypothetical protein [Amycolatopsis umgeniensis]MBB5850633.1 V8-like Glu-specific endopeptidase [Amycolatopsis umgeniensis]
MLLALSMTVALLSITAMPASAASIRLTNNLDTSGISPEGVDKGSEPNLRTFQSSVPRNVQVNGKTKDFTKFNEWSADEKKAYLESVEIIPEPGFARLAEPKGEGSPPEPPLNLTIPPSKPSIAPPAPIIGGGGTTQAAWDAVYPSPTVGKLYLFKGDTMAYNCSGALVTANNRGTVLTASHCLEDTGITGVVYVPQEDNGRYPYGAWSAWGIYMSQCYNPQTTECDWAFALIPTLSDGSGIQDHTGANGIGFGYESLGGQIDVAGYPFQPSPRFNGKYQWRCTAPGTTVPVQNIDRFHYADECRMGPGASGGPWLVNYSSSSRSGIVAGVSSWTICGVDCNDQKAGLYSSRLLSRAGYDYSRAQVLVRPS